MGNFAPFQEEKLSQLQEELRMLRPQVASKLPRKGTSGDGYAFTEVEGVTVVLIARRTSKPWGGYKLPAVIEYGEEGKRPRTSLDAALRADILFKGQSRGSVGKTGHFHPVVNTDWKCRSADCPCQDEGEVDRKNRSLSGNRKR
ncbi:MAG TPA: hypothetical protein VIH89_10225 [Candidatus Sulfotelmatobacter sp.]